VFHDDWSEIEHLKFYRILTISSNSGCFTKFDGQDNNYCILTSFFREVKLEYKYLQQTNYWLSKNGSIPLNYCLRHEFKVAKKFSKKKLVIMRVNVIPNFDKQSCLVIGVNLNNCKQQDIKLVSENKMSQKNTVHITSLKLLFWLSRERKLKFFFYSRSLLKFFLFLLLYDQPFFRFFLYKKKKKKRFTRM